MAAPQEASAQAQEGDLGLLDWLHLSVGLGRSPWSCGLLAIKKIHWSPQVLLWAGLPPRPEKNAEVDHQSGSA